MENGLAPLATGAPRGVITPLAASIEYAERLEEPEFAA